MALIDKCPNCEEPKDGLRPFVANSRVSLSILAEAVLAELPEFPSDRNVYLPAHGRRLLAFSDSRGEAARLGPQLARQHTAQLIRAAVVNTLADRQPYDEATLEDLREELERCRNRLQNPSLTAAQRQNYEQRSKDIAQQLEAAQSGGAIPSWAKSLRGDPRIPEVFDLDYGEKHQAEYGSNDKDRRPWGQAEWQRNRTSVENKAEHFLAAEFAGLSTRTISAEKLGMAEVTYPGLESLDAPSSLLGYLSDDASRTQVAHVWTPLLEGLCDTLASTVGLHSAAGRTTSPSKPAEPL